VQGLRERHQSRLRQSPPHPLRTHPQLVPRHLRMPAHVFADLY
jgi:hypothetical protein